MKPHILYLMPGMVSSGPLGQAELSRRRNILEDWAGANACVEVDDLEEGAGAIECFSDEALSATPTAERVLRAAESGVDAIIMVVLGGMGSLTGSVVAAVFVTIIPEFVLRPLQEYTGVDLRMVIYSLALILFMIARPKGIFGTLELPDLWINNCVEGWS